MIESSGTSDDDHQVAREALVRAQSLLNMAASGDANQILDNARLAMAALEEVEMLLGTSSGFSPPGKVAKGRILEYFLERGINVPVAGSELRRVAGIQEWARRVRELRVEEGWDIRYDGRAYRLLGEQPNEEVAEAWRLAHEMRGSGASVKDRILKYLQAKVGQVVNGELLDYLSGTQDHGGPLRELRTMDGYAISTCVDRPDLQQDEYLLEYGSPVLEADERGATETLRKTVLERDDYRCVVCDRGHETGVVLSVFHLEANLEGESDSDPESFVTLCREDRLNLTAEQQKQLGLRRRRRIGN